MKLIHNGILSFSIVVKTVGLNKNVKFNKWKIKSSHKNLTSPLFILYIFKQSGRTVCTNSEIQSKNLKIILI